MKYSFSIILILILGCSKPGTNNPGPVVPDLLQLRTASVNGIGGSTEYYINNFTPEIRFSFSAPIDKSTATSGIVFTHQSGSPALVYDATFSSMDSAITIIPRSGELKGLNKYSITINRNLKSASGGALSNDRNFSITTHIDSVQKFPTISDDSLLTLVQKQTFRYFWEFGHPVSGMARERNTSGEIVTTGGTGFGIMGMVVAVDRNFITRQQALQRITTIADFLQTKATKYHGAFAHWINGTTGATIPFSANDNGADLVESSFLMMGLLTAKQYFNSTDPAEVALRQKITALYQAIEWNWFRRNNENVLYWHWSPDKDWTINLRIQGWNECLITYVLAAGSPSYPIPDTVYHKGWAQDGSMRNGNAYFGIQLPLGSSMGGPLFLSHYSFLGISPKGLKDTYASYDVQNNAHSLINYSYCVSNPQNRRGYSNACWGLTASDYPGGYTASSPTNDRGTIAPTAAIGSMPYSPQESMRALKFFYYTLGDKLWKEYGFIDAFSIHELWFASSFLAIDQGPQIVMIENHRSGLIWQLGMQIPEVRQGLKKLGFTSPLLP